MSSCPNISSPEWKELVNKIGENNSWREFLANGYIPSADNYDIVKPVFETENKDVLYSIRTKSLEQLAKGLNTDLVRSEQQIKYSGYIKSMVLNLLGDIAPGKKLKMSPNEAFQKAKETFLEINNDIAVTLNSHISSEEDLQIIKNSESYGEMLDFLPVLKYVDTYEDLVKASNVYKNVVDDFNSYVDFVKIDLAHNGIKITKGKIENIDIKEKTTNEEDETSNDTGSISQNEIGERYGKDVFEVNPRDSATPRVKALIQTILTGEYEFGVPLYANPNDVFADMLEIGSDINLAGYKSGKTKLQAFKKELSERATSRPYLKNLLEKIINYENNNQWDNINDILTVSSKSYATETLLLYNLKRVGSDVFGINNVKIISTNRDTVDRQISKEWLFQHLQSGFYRTDSFGDIFPKQEKINELTKIIEEGKDKDKDSQIKKFQEFFNVLGIEFSENEAKSIYEKLPKLLKKSNFNQFFVKNNLLNNIVDSFQTHIKEPFIGQYGFENENTSMKKIAKLYYLENPGKYKITSTKTADGKSKYSYIFPTYLEQIKREWSNGKTSSITNGVLSKPNSQKQTSFWQKVISGNAKFDLQYFNGVREQKAGQKGDVRKTLTPKEQIVSMFLKHQQNLNVGSYIAFTLSDKTTTMETSMTKEFFVDKDDANPVGFNSDYTIENGGIVYTTALKRKIYNSFVEPEISRILASIKNKKSTNIENHEIASKLFYFFPNLNRNSNLIDFRNDLYSGEFTIEELAVKYGDVVSQAVLNEMIMASEKQVDDLISMNVIAVDDKNNYTFPTFINGYNENDYVNRFRKVSTTGRNMARLMVMDMKLNYLNSQIKTIQFLKFDPALAFKTSIDVKDKSISDIDVNDRVEMANSTWDEFSKRAAALIAPGSQGSWFWNLPNGEEYTDAGKDYLTVTGKDIKKEIKNTDGSKLNKSETTDAQELVIMQEHIDYLMSEGKMDINTWYSIYKKIKDAGPGGYYTLTSEELGIVFSPIKPVHVNSVAVGDVESGLNRIDYIKSSRYPLIPQHEAGSERDKLRIWMEKNNVRSINFGSGKKIGRPTKSLTLFDENNNFIEPTSEDFESSKQFLSRDGLRNQQEIPDQKDKIRTVSQMNRTLFDGLLGVDDFQFGNMKDVSGATGKTLKEAVRSRLFDIETAKLKEKLGDNLNRDHRKLYALLKDVIVNDTTGSYSENDLNSLKINPKTNQFEIPLEGLWKLTKFQSLINSLINKNVMLKVDGSSFIQVSGVGAKFTFSKISKGVKSDIIWLDKHAKQFSEDGATLKYMRQVDGKTKAAQVIVSQYLRDEDGNLINLANYIKEDKYGRKILDTSTFDEKMFQLIGTRIPNQSHPSTLPIEVVGFLPSYMENSMVVPDGITGQMGSDFDVDKLYAYFSKFKYNEKSTTEKLGANQEEYDELVNSAKKIAEAAGEKADKKGMFKNFNTYLSQAVKEKYGDAEVPKFKIEKPASIEQVTYDLNSLEDVNKFSEDQLKQLYRDIHWEVLMNPAAFSKITNSVDLPEVKSKVDIRNEQLKKYKLDEDVKVNLPLDFTTSINRYIDNRSGKTGVSIFATLISAQADFQDKIINLSFDGVPNPLQIKLSKNGKAINLEFIGKLGKSKSFLYEPGKIEERSISDNLNIMFTESVDNAKNQFLREFNWSDKAMSSVGVLAMLSDSNGDSAPIEIMMDLTSQPAIFELFKLIEQKQDSFGQYESDAILTSAKELQNGIIKKIDNEGYLPVGSTAQSYFEDKTRNDVIDAESLSESWIIGKAVMQKASKETLEQIAKDFKYDSVNDMMLNYYNTQYNSIDTYIRLEDLGRELMTILGAIYPYTKGIGANVFSTKQRLNQLNKLQFSSNFSGLENIAGEITKLDNGDIQLAEPVGEIGSNIKNSLLFAQDLYKSLFPISSGEELESIVDNILNFMGLDKFNLSKDKYETFYSTVFDSIVSYMKTNSSFELFKNSIEERNKLINGESSIGYRVLELKKDSKYSKNGFLKNIEVEKDYKSDTYTISFKAPFGTDVDEKEVSLGFYNLALDENNDIKQLAKDFALYPHLTGDAGYLGRYIPVGYYMSDVDYKKAMADFQNMFNKHITTSGSKAILIDQIVQNYSEVFSKQFSFTTTNAVDGTYNNPFKKVFTKIVKSQRLKDVTTFTFKIGDFPDTAKYKSIIKSLKIPLTENELKSIKESSLVNIPAGIDFKYPKYLLIKDQVVSDIPGVRGEDISYLYKRTSSIVTELGDATYERIEILGFKNISEFDFNNPNLVSSIKMNNVSRDENEQDAGNDILNQSTTKTSEQKGTSNPADYTNHSGGAALSDAEWDQIGREFGVFKHKHYREPLEYIDTKGQPAKGSKDVDSKKLQAAGIKPTYIEQEDYDEGAKKATQAFRMMFEDAGNKSVRSAYIIRNWMQVKNADAIYALGTIKQPGENASDKAGETRIAAIPIVKGGTGYAVQMAINEGKPVYVFDGTKEGWYTYDYKVKNFVPTEPPTLTKNFAGIGSRSLSTQEVIDKSLQAIRDVYEKTFKSTQPSTNIQKSAEEPTEPVKTYQGKIESLKPNQIFVFGSNPQGRHGAGAAKQAKDKFGAVQFIGRGLRNQTYALVTKNLTAGFVEKETGIKYEKAGEKSLTSEQIQTNIKELYDVALQNPDKEFVVAYSVDGKKNLNGYTDQDMANMFSAFPIPDNMVFEEGFSKLLSIKTTEPTQEIKKEVTQQTQKNDVITVGSQITSDYGLYKGSTYTVVSISTKDVKHGNKIYERDYIILKGINDKKIAIYGTINNDIFIGSEDSSGNRYSTATTVQFNLIKEIEEPIEQPEVKSTVVEYGGKNYIIEGTMEDGYNVYFQAQGEKGKPVSDTNLLSKVILTHEVNLHPDRVVTLTSIQNQPKYFVDFEGSIKSLQKTSFGDVIQSKDVIQRVMSLYYDKSQIETPEIKPQQLIATSEEDIFGETEEELPPVQEKPIKKEKRINVPEGSNPNNNVIMESEDTISLMNDGQQEAFDFIKGKVENLLANKKIITESDLEKTVAFTDPLTQKFNGLIPMDMWNNMIGLAGRGGVGKTTVIKAIIAAIEGKNKYAQPSVMYLTPTHTAATVLQESLGLDSEIANDGVVNTIASQTRRNKMIDGVLSLSNEIDYIKSTQFKPAMGQPDIIIVDESSMIGQKDFGDILLRIKQDLKNGLISRLPIFIFMGDYRQLGPIGEQQSKDVNKGLISSTLLLDKSKTKELIQVMRSDNKILHKIYDQVGNEIVENIENLKNNRPVKKLSFDKYDKLTNKSSENILVVKNEDGVIDDYTNYLIQNNNPYGMFWVHYNNVEHGNTKNLSKKIRNDYFKKLGLDFSSPSYRLYANQDYIIFNGKVEIATSEYEYIPSDDKIKKLLDKQKYTIKNGAYKINRGAVKPGARFKVLDIETKSENIANYVSGELLKFLPKNMIVEIEHTIVYNRQDRIRHIHKVLGIEVVGIKDAKTGEFEYGKYNTKTKSMEGIQIKNTKTGEVISTFDLKYGDYLNIFKPELDQLNEFYTPPYVPSYIGSSHTAQGNSIKNVIVGDYNIKKNAASNVNQDDIFSSMYVALTRTSGSLIIIKPAGTDIVNNQEVFLGAITDDNQAQRMTSASEIKSDIEEAENEIENEPIDFIGDLFSQIMQSDQNDLITDIFGKDKNADAKTILNSLYKSNISPFYKQVLDLVGKTGGVGNLKIIVDETMTDPGSYNRYEQTIRINPKLAFESDTDNINALYDVIIHELFHHVTANIIEMDKSKLTPDQRKWVISLENLFKSTQEKILNDPAHSDNLKNAIAQVNKEGGFLSAKDKSFYYGLTNIHDFVSMLMSDENFRDFMNNTSYSGEKTLMERFIDIFVNILKALGISVKEDSVLKEGIKNVIGIVESRNQNDAQTDQTLKSIKTKSFLDGIVESEFDKIINYLDIKTKCK